MLLDEIMLLQSNHHYNLISIIKTPNQIKPKFSKTSSKLSLSSFLLPNRFELALNLMVANVPPSTLHTPSRGIHMGSVKVELVKDFNMGVSSKRIEL